MTYPHDRYSDILFERHDPKIEQVIGQLDTVGQEFPNVPMPPAYEARIMAALRAHALVSRRPKFIARRGRSALRRAMLLAAAALIVIALFTGATLARNPRIPLELLHSKSSQFHRARTLMWPSLDAVHAAQ